MTAKTTAVFALAAAAALSAASACRSPERPARADAATSGVAGVTARADDGPGAATQDPSEPTAAGGLPGRAEPLTAAEARVAILAYLDTPAARRQAFLRESRPFVEGEEASETRYGFHWGPWWVNRHTGQANLVFEGEFDGSSLQAVVTTAGGRPELTEVELYDFEKGDPADTEPAGADEPRP